MITEVWIDKMIVASEEAEASCLVGSIVEQQEHDKKQSWMLRYLAEWVASGVALSFAVEQFRSAQDSHDYDSDPKAAAQSDMDTIFTE